VIGVIAIARLCSLPLGAVANYPYRGNSFTIGDPGRTRISTKPRQCMGYVHNKETALVGRENTPANEKSQISQFEALEFVSDLYLLACNTILHSWCPIPV